MALFSSQSTTAQTHDILEQKRNSLSLYNAQFERAVSLVTDTIDGLGRINDDITQTMLEIEAYEKELAVTKAGLADARSKNDRVISNFKSLLN